MTFIPTLPARKTGIVKVNRNMIIRGAAIALLMIGSAIGNSSAEAILAMGIVAVVGAYRYTGSTGSPRDGDRQPRIIFGWRTRARWTHNKTQSCGQCQGPTLWAFFRVRRWFTLFSVPIFPAREASWICQCRQCGEVLVTQSPVTTTVQQGSSVEER